MSGRDDEDGTFARIASTINKLNTLTRRQLPWTEQELYERAFKGDDDHFATDLDGEPIIAESVLEKGPRAAAMALLGVALSEELSLSSRAAIRHIYDALNPDAYRGHFKLKLALRRTGRKPPSYGDEVRQSVTDAVTAVLVKLAQKKFGKKEAAVAYVADLRKVSRAEVFRALARAKDGPP